MRRGVTFMLLPAFFVKAVVCAALFITGSAVLADAPPCHHDQKKEQGLDCCKAQPLEKTADKLDLPPALPVLTAVIPAVPIIQNVRPVRNHAPRLFLSYQILLI